MQLSRLSLAVAIAVAFSCHFVHAALETVELDLVFPRNETYRPVYPFPIVFALRNPAAIWPFDFTLFSTLEWWNDEENRIVSTRAGFDQLGHFPNSGSGAYSHSPVYPDDLGDPLFIINASFVVKDIINTTSTPATLRWHFGLDRNCSENVHPEYTVGRPRQMLGHIDLKFANDGALPDFGEAYNDGGCPVGIGAIDIAGQMEFNEGTHGGACPILPEIDQRPKPDPCQLTVDEELGTRVANAMMASEQCDEGAVWPNPTATSCEQMVSLSPCTMQASIGWTMSLALAIAGFVSIQAFSL